MAGTNASILSVLREVRGANLPGVDATDGIYYELTKKPIDGNDGIYGDMIAKYNAIAADSGTLVAAKDLIENLSVNVTELEIGEEATGEVVGSTFNIAIPKAAAGKPGLTPKYKIVYNEDTGYFEQVLLGYYDMENVEVLEGKVDNLESRVDTLEDRVDVVEEDGVLWVVS